MSRLLVVVTTLCLVGVSLQTDSLLATQSCVLERHSDALGTASEGPLANATKTDLATEREKLVKELCKAGKGPSAPILDTETKAEAATEGGKAVVVEQKTEQLPGNKTKEIVITEETEKLPSNATVKKTVERQVVKGADGKATGSETVIEKETLTDISPSNATVTSTVKEHKVVKGEEVEKEAGEEKTETEKEEEKAEKTEKIETGEIPEPVKLPANATIKKTSVERKVVKDTIKDGEPQKEIVIEKTTTRTDTTKATETPTLGMVNASVLEDKTGPKKIVVRKKKVEKMAGNETKVVVVQVEAEKLPSNDTIQKTVVEIKVTKDKGKDSESPQQETVIEKEVEVQITNKTGEAKAAEKDKKQEYKEKLENIKRQVEEVKALISDEEIKADKVDGAAEVCMNKD